MRERFDREFRALLDSDNPETQSIWTYIARLLQQFCLDKCGITVDEILSDVYSRGIQRIVERKKPIENPLGWIRLTALNVVREMWRSQRRSVPLDSCTWLEFELTSTEAPEILVAGEEIENNIQILYAALQQLTIEDKEILYWRFIDGLSWYEIGQCLVRNGEGTLNEATLRQRGCRALARLRQLFHQIKSEDPVFR